MVLAIPSVRANEAEVDDGEFKFPTAADYPKVRTNGSKPIDFVPKGWKILGQCTGDLNGDRAADAAIAVQANYARFKQPNKFLGNAEFDTNPRMLIILFKDPLKKNFHLAEQPSSIIPIPDGPNMEEPFESIKIKERTLQLATKVFFSAGSWFTSSSIYKFKYLNSKFYLVGAEVTEFQRNSGEETLLSYNFYSNKLKKVTSNGVTEDINEEPSNKKRVKWINLPKRKLRAMSSFKKIGEWTVFGDYSL